MKKLILAFLLISISAQLFSQLVVATPDDLVKFKKTKTVVFLESNMLLAYNQEIQKAVKKHWDITPFEFKKFDNNEFELERLDPNKSFLIMNESYIPKDKTRAVYKFLNVSLGGDYKLEKQMPTISGLPVAYAEVEEDTYDYKLGLILRFIQEHIKVSMENPEINKTKKMLKYYRNELTTIADKTLYVLEEELGPDVNTMKEIKAVYPYDVKIATKEEIQKVIDSRDEKAVILHQVGPKNTKRKARCWNVVMGASDAKLYYFNFHMIKRGKRPEGLLLKDFKKLSKEKGFFY
ncbi:MAG: hypothetical protein C0599_03040 [Salinivirgaceae bacterium]|nr:MAG: hypothetical protein C0599_03040 [Salinivirgaceae bacterium]